ncbi:uncharacterized protein LOC127240039 [Andrographis paniculata]|uniref:uncharacterized protein LOC127240039 n=1 Tax=Andrographis paniculata TaxID=175694 RepID=UPI0021E76595|nr:uncharacterized protein LOC127240039 [Andrographis paniculata]
MAGINNSNEPSTAPQADRWYDLTLGSSFKDLNPSRFCTFRYEFKPASIDKNQRGTLHKSKDNKVTVEFHNIQPGKPKVTFEGSSEDYKDNDAVLFFDGESFRLERLHRAVKRLRHNRSLGESTGTALGHSDASSPPVGKVAKHQPVNKDLFPAVPVEVERIEIGDFKSSDAKPRQEKTVEYPPPPPGNSSNPSPSPKNDDQDEHLDIMNDDDDNGNEVDIGGSIEVKELNFDINEPHPTYSEDEIADVDVSDDEGDKGPNAAEALRAQVAGERDGGETSSSSGSSGSESSGSGSGTGSKSASSSSSSDSESSDADSVTSV